MINTFYALSMAGDIVAAPPGIEFGALTGKLGNQVFGFRRCSRSRHVSPKGVNHQPRYRLPVILRTAYLRIGEQPAQNITFRGGNRE